MLATYVAASSMGSHSAPELLPPLGSSPRPQRTNVPERGEHDSIMSLLRVLEFGQDAKMVCFVGRRRMPSMLRT